ncbi:lytic transglycosylase domain-containing protein [Actinokineospora enzanensis]|uniref:lytic transglycosylase domain-containing protein n=1 Tax=Actinokineospora enzanensis TaxID=155975 RepID=UPI000370E374|nr:lytic transglycosylase domain-containing protein [Actinokineospora enzanensis]
MVTSSRGSAPGGARPVTALALVLLTLAAAAAQASGPVPESSAEPAAPTAIAPQHTPADRVGAVTTESLRLAPALGPITQVPAPAPVARVEPAAKSPITSTGIPRNMLTAYQHAEHTVRASCHLRWYHLAAIGRVESGHARGGQATANGDTSPHILGPVLSGADGFAAIPDTDHGTLDDDPVWDRAVGPMQFIPSTWHKYAADGNGDGITDPHNINDATVAAAHYLCSGGLDLDKPDDLGAALFRYNNSADYVVTVTTWMTAYSGGATPIPPVPPADPALAQPAPPPAPEPATEATPTPDPTPEPTTEPSPSTDPSAVSTPTTSTDATTTSAPAPSEPAAESAPSDKPVRTHHHQSVCEAIADKLDEEGIPHAPCPATKTDAAPATSSTPPPAPPQP